MFIIQYTARGGARGYQGLQPQHSITEYGMKQSIFRCHGRMQRVESQLAGGEKSTLAGSGEYWAGTGRHGADHDARHEHFRERRTALREALRKEFLTSLCTWASSQQSLDKKAR